MSRKWGNCRSARSSRDVLEAQGVVGSLAQSGIRTTRNGQSFGKYGQTVLTDAVNYRVLRTRKNRKITS